MIAAAIALVEMLVLLARRRRVGRRRRRSRRRDSRPVDVHVSVEIALPLEGAVAEAAKVQQRSGNVIRFVVEVELLFGLVVAAAFHAPDAALELVLILGRTEKVLLRHEGRVRVVVEENPVHRLEMAPEDARILRRVIGADAAFHEDALVGRFDVHLEMAPVGRRHAARVADVLVIAGRGRFDTNRRFRGG